jgi:hypothetical protein
MRTIFKLQVYSSVENNNTINKKWRSMVICSKISRLKKICNVQRKHNYLEATISATSAYINHMYWKHGNLMCTISILVLSHQIDHVDTQS